MKYRHVEDFFNNFFLFIVFQTVDIVALMVNGWSRLNRMKSNRTNEPAVRFAKVNRQTNETTYNNSQSGLLNQQTSNGDRTETTGNDPRKKL